METYFDRESKKTPGVSIISKGTAHFFFIQDLLVFFYTRSIGIVHGTDHSQTDDF